MKNCGGLRLRVHALWRYHPTRLRSPQTNLLDSATGATRQWWQHPHGGPAPRIARRRLGEADDGGPPVVGAPAVGAPVHPRDHNPLDTVPKGHPPFDNLPRYKTPPLPMPMVVPTRRRTRPTPRRYAPARRLRIKARRRAGASLYAEALRFPSTRHRSNGGPCRRRSAVARHLRKGPGAAPRLRSVGR